MIYQMLSALIFVQQVLYAVLHESFLTAKFGSQPIQEMSKNDGMNLTVQIAKQLREVHFVGNWTDSALKENLAGVTWQQATTKVQSFNTIVALVYHMNYSVSGVSKVLEGGPLDIKDKYSFKHPPVLSQEGWEKMLDKTWAEVETLPND